MNPTAKEIEIIENIYHSQPDMRQRDLAQIAGLSLGMTNAILKRLAQKGWITVRKVNNRNISYAVSPEGMDLIMRKSDLDFIVEHACGRSEVELIKEDPAEHELDDVFFLYSENYIPDEEADEDSDGRNHTRGRGYLQKVLANM